MIHLGKWQDAIGDVDVDALICDPPYSAKTHASCTACALEGARDTENRRAIDYAHWTPEDCHDFVKSWHPRVSGWIILLTDHINANHLADALLQQGRYVFAPLPYVAIGSRVRLTGDGPSSWTCWIVVARPKNKEYSNWGTLPGAYALPPGFSERMAVVGGKPLWLMEQLVRDYSRPGDLVCDPCMGAGTTGVACLATGREFVGAEMDQDTFEIARKRLAAGHTAPLFAEE